MKKLKFPQFDVSVTNFVYPKRKCSNRAIRNNIYSINYSFVHAFDSRFWYTMTSRFTYPTDTTPTNNFLSFLRIKRVVLPSFTIQSTTKRIHWTKWMAVCVGVYYTNTYQWRYYGTFLFKNTEAKTYNFSSILSVTAKRQNWLECEYNFRWAIAFV